MVEAVGDVAGMAGVGGWKRGFIKGGLRGEAKGENEKRRRGEKKEEKVRRVENLKTLKILQE